MQELYESNGMSTEKLVIAPANKRIVANEIVTLPSCLLKQNKTEQTTYSLPFHHIPFLHPNLSCQARKRMLFSTKD